MINQEERITAVHFMKNKVSLSLEIITRERVALKRAPFYVEDCLSNIYENSE